MKHVFLCLFMMNSIYCFSQKGSFFNPPIDTNYINKLPSKWSARLYSASKYNQFHFWNDTVSTRFYPDTKIGLGAGVSYNNFALDLSANIYSSNPSEKSKNIGLLSSLYANQNIFEFSLQTYSHFSSNVTGSSGDEIQSEFRKDISAFNLGINYNYNFNYKKFSFNAPFIATQIQKRSAGTPLAGAYWSYFHLHSDTPLLIINELPGLGTDSFFTYANLFTVGITGGYAYTFVLPAHLYITLSGNVKLAYNAGSTSNLTLPFQIIPGFLTRNAIGYSGLKIYGFVSGLLDYNVVKIRNNEYLSYDPIKIKVLVGYRFH